MQTDGRGEPLGTLRIGRPPCIPVAIVLLAGCAFVVIAFLPMDRGSAAGVIAVRAVCLVGGPLLLGLTIARLVQIARERLLVFENGLVFRNWRGGQRFIPWDRLEAVDVRPRVVAGFNPVSATVVLEVAGEHGREEIAIGWDTLGMFSRLPETLDELAEVLARHTDLRYRPGTLVADAPRWERERR